LPTSPTEPCSHFQQLHPVSFPPISYHFINLNYSGWPMVSLGVFFPPKLAFFVGYSTDHLSRHYPIFSAFLSSVSRELTEDRG
jgi:hypothetical protein